MKKLIFIILSVFFLIYPYSAFPTEDFFARGITEFKAENYDEALELLKKAKKQQPDSHLIAFYLGLIYKQMGDYREALRHYKDAITLKIVVIDAYPEIIETLYNLNEFKEAKKWIEKAESGKIKPAQVSFLKGLVLLKEARWSEAIEAFKESKEFDKSFTQAAEFQIAMIYAKERRIKKAQESLKAVIKINPTSDIANFAKEYEKVLAKILETYKAWRFTLGMSHLYDNNVVAKPSSDIGVKFTDVGGSSTAATFTVNYAPFISDSWAFNTQYNLNSNNYWQTSLNKTHRSINHSLSLIPNYNFRSGAVSLPVSYGYTFLRGDKYMGLLSIKPTLNILLIPGHIGQFSLGYSKRDMLIQIFDADEDRDSNIFSSSIGYLYPFSEDKGVFNAKYEYSIDNTRGKNWVNNGNKITMSVFVFLRKGMSLTASGETLLQYYKNHRKLQVFKFDAKRRDIIYSGSIGLIWELIAGLSLNLQYSHTKTDSNIPIYEYNKAVYAAGLEYRF